MLKGIVKQLVGMVDVIKGTSFVSAVYRSKETGELARYVLNVGIKHHRVLRRDLETLKRLSIDTVFFTMLALKYGEETVKKAFHELEESLKSSLEGTNTRAQAQIDAYIKVNNGVKLGTETKELYLYGYLISKTTLEPGTYKAVKSRPLTLCKNEIKGKFKSGKYRTLRFDGTCTFTTEGKTLVIE